MNVSSKLLFIATRSAGVGSSEKTRGISTMYSCFAIGGGGEGEADGGSGEGEADGGGGEGEGEGGGGGGEERRALAADAGAAEGGGERGEPGDGAGDL